MRVDLNNLILTLGLIACVSRISFTSNCNIIVDTRISFYQSIYGSIFSLIAYKMTNKVLEPDTYIFEDYKLGKKSPRTLKKIN
jgi:hypothetical protein